MLSPRKIMMDSRDRIEEIGKNIDSNGGEFKQDGKSLVGNYISEEELWACTSCQACVEACPINISPMGIILDMRRSLIMEESKSPEPISRAKSPGQISTVNLQGRSPDQFFANLRALFARKIVKSSDHLNNYWSKPYREHHEKPKAL